MKFAATLIGLTPKDTAVGSRLEIKLLAPFDTSLLAQLGECFTDRVAVQINDPQLILELEATQPQEEEQPQ